MSEEIFKTDFSTFKSYWFWHKSIQNPFFFFLLGSHHYSKSIHVPQKGHPQRPGCAQGGQANVGPQGQRKSQKCTPPIFPLISFHGKALGAGACGPKLAHAEVLKSKTQYKKGGGHWRPSLKECCGEQGLNCQGWVWPPWLWSAALNPVTLALCENREYYPFLFTTLPGHSLSQTMQCSKNVVN